MVDDVIIMAGGSGTRLWPASIRSRPKQFMDPGLGMSLLEATIRRAAALEPPGDILIVAHRDHVDPIVEECAALPEEIRDTDRRPRRAGGEEHRPGHRGVDGVSRGRGRRRPGRREPGARTIAATPGPAAPPSSSPRTTSLPR